MSTVERLSLAHRFRCIRLRRLPSSNSSTCWEYSVHCLFSQKNRQYRQWQVYCFTYSTRSSEMAIRSNAQEHISFQAIIFPQERFPAACNYSGLLFLPSSSNLFTLELRRSASSLSRSRGLVIVSSSSTLTLLDCTYTMDSTNHTACRSYPDPFVRTTSNH